MRLWVRYVAAGPPAPGGRGAGKPASVTSGARGPAFSLPSLFMEIQGSPHREDCSSLSLQTRRLGFNINNPLLKLNFTPWSLATCTGARGESCPSRPGRARLYFTLQRKCRENPLSLSWRQYWFVTKSSLPMIVRWETFAGRCMYPTINGFPFLYGDIFFFLRKECPFLFFQNIN